MITNIGEVLLTEDQKRFISSMINIYGDGQHPMCDSNSKRLHSYVTFFLYLRIITQSSFK